jgi:hypothetical protein
MFKKIFKFTYIFGLTLAMVFINFFQKGEENQSDNLKSQKKGLSIRDALTVPTAFADVPGGPSPFPDPCGSSCPDPDPGGSDC